ncbi:MAG: chitobiase/beta-hexosaminidase C-terminal domain-containing protein, partial [Bacteroidales bacterium]|nr:chitobiase/beta-hexosaminidase C-terminal domain-containing protein [Bacteroidales bacterium]
MKKMTNSLIGLPRLLISLGIAFANGKAATLPTPTFTPASGSTIAPGTKIEFDIPDEAQSTGSVYVFYTVNDADNPLETTYKELSASVEDRFQGLPFKVALAMADEDDVMRWSIPCVITESGNVTFRARLAIAQADANGGTDDNMGGGGDGTLAYSEIIEATYRVEGDIARPYAPTFSPAPGALTAGNRNIRLTSRYGDDPLHMTYYAIDGNDEVFEANTYDELLNLEDAGKITFYTSPIPIDRPLTIKAVTFEVNAATYSVLRSDIVKATYWPDDAEEPLVTVAAPKFSPNGGEVAKNSRVSLTSATYGAKIHYTVDGSEPTAQSTEYTSPIIIDRDMTVKAVALFGTKSASDVVASTYTVTGSEVPPVVPEKPAETVAAPTFSVPAGEVEKDTEVGIACATEGAEIYWSFGRSEPISHT